MDPEKRAEVKRIANELKELLRVAKECGDPLLVYLIERAIAQAEKPDECGDPCEEACTDQACRVTYTTAPATPPC